MPKPETQCRGCGSSEAPLNSLYGQMYRPPKDGKHIHAIPKVTLCDKCLKDFTSDVINARTVEIVHAIAESVKAGYNAIKGARK